MKKYFHDHLIVFMFFASTLSVLIIMLYTGVMMKSAADFLKYNIEGRLLALSRLAAQLATAEELGELVTSDDMNKPIFLDIKRRLAKFAGDSDITYAYYLRDIGGDEMQFIVDNDFSGETVNLATPPLAAEESPKMAQNGVASTSGLGNYSIGYDNLLSAFAPVFDGEGRVVAVAGVDVFDERTILIRNRIATLIIFMLSALIIVVISGFEGLSLYRKKALQSEASDIAKGAFLSHMSHEMRTPMNAIIGMTAIAKMSNDAPKKDHCIEKIEEASSHLLGVINDILDLSKIEANKLELLATDFDLEKMLQRTVGIVSFQVDDKKQNLTVHVGRDVPFFLSGDEQRLAQVITNLLGNSVKFTPEGGSISLDVRLIDENDGVCTLRISVTDTGIGISEEQQSRLFSSFEQAELSTSHEFGGTGLGLAISKRIVGMMGGRIWIESELGHGSSFIFTVRLKRVPEDGRDLLAPGVDWNNVRILAADDLPAVLECFTEISERLGVACDLASDWEETCAKMEQNGPHDVCFLGWKMRGMDWPELSRQIKGPRGNRSSVVIMASAVEWSAIEKEATEAGVDKFLTKPVFASSISGVIGDVMGSGASSETKCDMREADCFEGCRALLAEDVEINREIVQTLLEPTGLSIICAENGAEAVEMYEKAPDLYDIILMDVQMPIVDGYEATRLIRALGVPGAKEIPIVAMTANVFREDIEKCLDAGMNDHVGKPLDIEEVLDRLRRYLPRGGRQAV
ncbi:MAG: response regulator [Synergistaceae bacterium]|jgi:signal transduction histidine kinase/CheY-like chemotaxis protein|nr:response regulator [Synergistaceae bacterium]